MDKIKLKMEFPSLKDYIGRSVRVRDWQAPYKESTIEIESLVFHKMYSTKLEINGHHLISALDFFAQMNGEKISEEDIKKFDETVFEVKPQWSKRLSRLLKQPIQVSKKEYEKLVTPGLIKRKT